MQITFNEHTFEVSKKEVEGVELFSLKDVENGWKEGKPEGASAKRLDHWKVKADVLELISLTEIRVVNIREGSSDVTYGDKDALIEYASHCSVPFRSSVRKAFIALTEGAVHEASDIALGVAVSDELIQREKALRAEMNGLIAQLQDKYAFNNYNRLAAKVISSYTPKQLTDGSASTFQYCVKLNHGLGASAYIAALEIIISSLRIGLDYQQCAALLKVETSKGKNKHLLVRN